MRSTFAVLAAALATPAIQAQPAEPLWEIGIGAFGISQQAYPGADQQVNRGIALPYALYRGEVLRVDRGGAGLRAVKQPAFEVDIGVSGAFGARSDDIEARRGMPDLGTLVEFAGLPVAGRHHRALADAEMAASLLLRLEQELERRFGLGPITHELLREIQASSRHAMRDCIARHGGRVRRV